MGLDPAYCAWLNQIPSVGNNARGGAYYETQSSSDKKIVSTQKTSSSSEVQSARGKQTHRSATAATHISTCTVFHQPKSCPAGIFVSNNCLYIADGNGSSVLKLPLSVEAGAPSTTSSPVLLGGGRRGHSLDKLNRPWRLCVDGTGRIFVCDRNNARVICIEQRTASPPETKNCVTTVVAGGNGAGSDIAQLDQPVGICLHPTDGSIFIADRKNHRVVRYPSPFTNGSVSPAAPTGPVVVAGGNGFGSALNQLACPAQVHVSCTDEGGERLYVSDEANNRVLRFCLDTNSPEGEIVAGGVGAGSGRLQLYHPLGIFVTVEEGGKRDVDLFVADSLNYRVQRFDLRQPGSTQTASSAQTVAGGARGSKIDQLGQPMSVWCDSQKGTLFVADSDNCRVQKFTKTEQDDCDRRSHKNDMGDTAKRQAGKCSQYNAKSGYGFVVDAKKRKYFAHHSDIAKTRSVVLYGYPALEPGDQVEFDAMPDAKWKVRASSIKVLPRRSESASK
jgi:cold shock CspA family protein